MARNWLRWIDKAVDRFGYWTDTSFKIYFYGGWALAVLSAVGASLWFVWRYVQMIAANVGWGVYVVVFFLALFAAIGLLTSVTRVYRIITRTNNSVSNIHADIVWGFEENLDYNILGMSQRHGTNTHEEVMIHSFQAQGTNIAATPIMKINSYIRSDITNEQIPVYINVRGTRYFPDDTYGIPPVCEFGLASAEFYNANEDPSNQGTPASTFVKSFGPFTFIFEYDGKTYQKSFDLEWINRVIKNMEDFGNPEGSQRPRITVRPSKKPVPEHLIKRNRARSD